MKDVTIGDLLEECIGQTIEVYCRGMKFRGVMMMKDRADVILIQQPTSSDGEGWNVNHIYLNDKAIDGFSVVNCMSDAACLRWFPHMKGIIEKGRV